MILWWHPRTYGSGSSGGTITAPNSDVSDSAVYDNIISVLSGLFTSALGWARIPNPYAIESNSITFLKQGYGCAFGPAINTNLELNCDLTTDRTLTVLISRESFKTDGDYQGYVDVTQDLLDDLRSAIKYLETNTTLNDGHVICTYESDSGIQSLQGDDFSVMYVAAVFKAKIFDNLND